MEAEMAITSSEIAEQVRDAIDEGLPDLCNAVEDKLFDFFKNHLEDQPYSAKCAECGKSLCVSDCTVDDDLDMTINIEPCKNCLENERDS
jgi:hypothetical protein